MKSSLCNKLRAKKRWSPVRVILISLALLPSWHVLGTFLFDLPISQAEDDPGAFSRALSLPMPSIPLDFEATAYCEEGITKSGVQTFKGIVAADPRYLPLGTWIRVEAPGYSGIYQVMDTGRLIRGRIIDIFIPSLNRALQFGRQNVKITVLKYAPFRAGPILLSD